MIASSKANERFSASMLIGVSVVFSLILGEGVVRMVFDPVDYLEAYLVDDKILGHKIRPGSSGHDSWGFRNKFVPTSAQIVAIGDSQTYGISASAKNSWPAQLQNFVRQDVYNLSLGGYGPVQYYYLLQNKALGLKPSVVIVGFYFGNDLLDAYQSVYTGDYWKWLRKSDFLKEDQRLDDNDSAPEKHKFMGNFRDWLAHHSVLYRMFTFSFGNLFRFFEMKYASSEDGNIAILEDREHNIRSGFTPVVRLRALNLEDPKVREGLRLTLELIRRMNDLCSKNSIAFMVALIPTKESVFADYIRKNGKFNDSDIVDQLIANEAWVNRLMKSYFAQNKISYIDVLPDLKSAAQIKTVYPQNEDGHPNAEGYEIIAKAVAQFVIHLKQPKTNAIAHSS